MNRHVEPLDRATACVMRVLPHRTNPPGQLVHQHTAARARSVKCVTGPQRTGALFKWHDVKP